MGKNENALLAIVYEYNRVTTAQENHQKFCVIFVLCVFQYFNMFMLYFSCFNSTVSVMFPLALNSFDMLLTLILISSVDRLLWAQFLHSFLERGGSWRSFGDTPVPGPP